MNVAKQEKLKKKIQTAQGLCAQAVKDLQKLENKVSQQVAEDFAKAVGLVERARKELSSALSSSLW